MKGYIDKHQYSDDNPELWLRNMKFLFSAVLVCF